MTVFDRVKKLADKQGISINTLEERTGFSKNYLYSWKKKVPSGNNLKVIADYFGVTTDYLLGRTDNPNPIQERVPDDLDKMLDNAMTFGGKPLTEIDRAAIRAYIEGRQSSKWGECMQLLETVLNECGVGIAYVEMESDGCYIEEEHIIFVNCSLSQEDRRKTIYHEIKHVVDHKEFIELYKIFYFRTKMEYEADRFMIENLVYDFLSECHIDPYQINIFSFMDYYELDYNCESTIRNLILEMVRNEVAV